MDKKLKLFLASLALIAGFGTQLAAITPELSPAEVTAVVETVEEVVEAVEETVAAKTVETVEEEVAAEQSIKPGQAEEICQKPITDTKQ
jgi:hypothetical protein